MAWVTSGSLIEKRVTEWTSVLDKEKDTNITRTGDVSCDTTCCLAVVLKSESDGVKQYVINVYTKKTGGLQYKGNATITTTTEYPNTSEKPTTFTQTFDDFSTLSTFYDGKDTSSTRLTATYSFVTSIPNFGDDNEALQKYIKTGDTSGAIKNVSTEWNLYIDGTKNPSYKLTDCIFEQP